MEPYPGWLEGLCLCDVRTPKRIAAGRRAQILQGCSDFIQWRK